MESSVRLWFMQTSGAEQPTAFERHRRKIKSQETSYLHIELGRANQPPPSVKSQTEWKPFSKPSPHFFCLHFVGTLKISSHKCQTFWLKAKFLKETLSLVQTQATYFQGFLGHLCQNTLDLMIVFFSCQVKLFLENTFPNYLIHYRSCLGYQYTVPCSMSNSMKLKVNIRNTSYLHCHWEVALGLRWEENIHRFLLERRVPCWWSSHLRGKQWSEYILAITSKMNPTSIMWSLPPAAPLTAKQKRVDSCWLPSILNWMKAAAWPSIGWDTFRSTLYSCIAPTTLT